MAETLRGSFAFSMATALGATAVTITRALTAESHTKSLRRTIVIPAGTTDFAVSLADFANVVLIVITSTSAITYRRGLSDTAIPCARFAVETPNVDVNILYVTTTTASVTLELLVVGD